MENNLKAWALERVTEQAGSVRKRAEQLKLSPAGYQKMLANQRKHATAVSKDTKDE